MPTDHTICDIVIAHGAAEIEIADELAAAFRDTGLEPFRLDEMTAEPAIEERARKAIAEGRALVAVVSGAAVPPLVVVAIGAAWVWEKPVYVLAAAKGSTPIPGWLTRRAVSVLGTIDEVVREVARAKRHPSRRNGRRNSA